MRRTNPAAWSWTSRPGDIYGSNRGPSLTLCVASRSVCVASALCIACSTTNAILIGAFHEVPVVSPSEQDCTVVSLLPLHSLCFLGRPAVFTCPAHFVNSLAECNIFAGWRTTTSGLHIRSYKRWKCHSNRPKWTQARNERTDGCTQQSRLKIAMRYIEQCNEKIKEQRQTTTETEIGNIKEAAKKRSSSEDKKISKEPAKTPNQL